MHRPIAVFAALFLLVMLSGCSGSATIPVPPSDAKDGPPPGTSPEMAKIPKNAGGTGPGAMQGAAPPPKPLNSR